MSDPLPVPANSNTFERIKRVTAEGQESWSARDLARVLEYLNFRNFQPVIEKAKEACIKSGHAVADHFAEIRNMVDIGSGAQREVEDWTLSRYACYLVIQNADPSKPLVALGQSYFAVQTRRQELADDEALKEDKTRLLLRGEMKKHNKNLAGVAKQAGVIQPVDYAIFMDHGYRGLYGGLGMRDIHQRKRLKSKEHVLDHMGSTELAANLFRATQTEEKLRRENVRNKDHANRIHNEVGRKVRKTIHELGGTMPENLPVASVELFRFPLAINNPTWNSVEVSDAGEFSPDNSNEGQSHEALLLHLLKPHFDGTVFASPKIQDGNKTRELCDVLALAKSAFLFEAKAFSVFDKSTEQNAERKAATVMKHFEKALGQLQGAAKRIENGVEILSDGLPDTSIAGNQFQTLHGIVAVSNTSFELPWLEIGKQLAEAQKPPRHYFHLLPLAEIQRMVAFAKGSSDTLNQMFIRRGEVIASSKEAHIQSDYIPEVSSVMKLTQVPGDCIGIRFVWVGEDAGDWLVRLFPLVYQQLRQGGFSGRLDFYHKIGMTRGLPAIGIGLAAQSISGPLGREWWVDFRQALFQSIEKAGLPQAAPNSEHIQTLKEITTQFPDLLLAVEFRAGFVVAKCAGEEI